MVLMFALFFSSIFCQKKLKQLTPSPSGKMKLIRAPEILNAHQRHHSCPTFIAAVRQKYFQKGIFRIFSGQPPDAGCGVCEKLFLIFDPKVVQAENNQHKFAKLEVIHISEP